MALASVGRYWEYPHAEMAITYEWFRSESADEGVDIVIAGDSTAARNIDPKQLAEGLAPESRGCNLGWPGNFPLAFERLTLPILKSSSKPPRVLVLSFSPLSFVDTPLAKEFEAGLLSSPICRRQEQGWLVTDVVYVARLRAALSWKQRWFMPVQEPAVPITGGFQPRDGTRDAKNVEVAQQRHQRMAEVSWAIDSRRFRVLQETADWARNQETVLYVVVPPRIEPGPERLLVEAEYLEKLRKAANELSFHILDLRDPANISREDYFDAGHLNRTGAEQFTNQLAEILFDLQR